MQSHLILFDGYCHLCNGSIQFILKHDSREIFTFAPLQSETGRKILENSSLETQQSDSIIYVRNGKILQKSDAVLRIAAELNFPANLLGGLIIFPTYLRNMTYDWVAKNRYSWFGKYNQCMIPDEKQKKRFIS